VTPQKPRPAAPTLREAEAAGNTWDVDVEQQLLGESAGGDGLPMALSRMSLPGCPFPDVPLPLSLSPMSLSPMSLSPMSLSLMSLSLRHARRAR